MERRVIVLASDRDCNNAAAFDFETLKNTLRDLKDGKSVQVPIYDFITHKRHALISSHLISSLFSDLSSLFSLLSSQRHSSV